MGDTVSSGLPNWNAFVQKTIVDPNAMTKLARLHMPQTRWPVVGLTFCDSLEWSYCSYSWSLWPSWESMFSFWSDKVFSLPISSWAMCLSLLGKGRILVRGEVGLNLVPMLPLVRSLIIFMY